MVPANSKGRDRDMKTGSRNLTVAAVVANMMLAPAAHAGNQHLNVELGDLDAQRRFPDQAAFCPPDAVKTKNVSPSVTWSPGPARTQSYALLMVDPDVPRDFSQINKAGTVIVADAPRVTIHHWVLIDIPPTTTSLPSGIDSDGVVPHGKAVGETGHGRRGANVFTSFFASNAQMAGTYGGYDGPCPPINDERVHRYVVRVFALDTPSLGLTGAFDGPAVEKAMLRHILAKGEVIGTYTLNPHLLAKSTP
jgi:Raf kinase inhibitor-like YbhB/YbcL family protein